jgi:hypothetical protein
MAVEEEFIDMTEKKIGWRLSGREGRERASERERERARVCVRERESSSE